MDIHGTSGPSRDSTSHVPISAASLKTKDKQKNKIFGHPNLLVDSRGIIFVWDPRKVWRWLENYLEKIAWNFVTPGGILCYDAPTFSFSLSPTQQYPNSHWGSLLKYHCNWNQLAQTQTQLKWIMQLAYLKHLTLTHPVGAIHTLYKVYMSYITSFSPLITQYTFS